MALDQFTKDGVFILPSGGEHAELYPLARWTNLWLPSIRVGWVEGKGYAMYRIDGETPVPLNRHWPSSVDAIVDYAYLSTKHERGSCGEDERSA